MNAKGWKIEMGFLFHFLYLDSEAENLASRARIRFQSTNQQRHTNIQIRSKKNQHQMAESSEKHSEKRTKKGVELVPQASSV